MATTNRQSLPTIKCSMCAKDIEISELGDHVCGPSGEPTPPLESPNTFDKMSFKQKPTNGSRHLKPGRTQPPRVDTSAANRPYLSQDQLTPVSASPSRYGSPNNGRNSPFRPQGPLRSATAPNFRRPPSPEMLSSNLECAFPAFPTAKSQQTLKPQHARAYGGRYAEADPMYAPVSPRTASSGGILERMNTIAPGPFDISRRKEGASAAQTHRRQDTAGSLEDMVTASRNEEEDSIARPSTAGPGHSRTSTNSSNGSKSGFAARGPKKHGYGGFGPPTLEPATFESPPRTGSKSQTFPLESPASGEPSRRPSEPSSRSRVRPAGGDRAKPLVPGPDLSRPLPPRGASLIRPRVVMKDGEVPPLPNLDLAEEFGVGNPYHTPTDSQSSDNSGFSEESQASSRSSPPRSNRGGQSRRKGSEEIPVDALMADLETSRSASPQKNLPLRSSPPRNYQSTGLPSNILPTKSREQFARPMVAQPILKNAMLAPESPMDPAIQMGLLSPGPVTPRSESPRSNNFNNSERRPSSSKGNCKGCFEPIKGKSISSADGRLTGRYHKHCFVCKTCSEPFQTSTFYVIDDAPYCERHYHKLNGSTCATCDKGIEGQYLESERNQKFHPGCLACADCKRVLKRDYFEMNGRVYCERDAWKRSQQPKFLGPGLGMGTNRMERRTTRMMMM